jgi:competence/damage-inducible protein CinA C-terminal domain
LLALLGDKVFGFDDDLLESVVGSLLLERKATLATAESCTGGLLGSRITDIAGSSRYYLGGVVCYTGDAKVALANVDRALLVEHGEVSEPVAIALARGVRERFGSTYGIGSPASSGLAADRKPSRSGRCTSPWPVRSKPSTVSFSGRWRGRS